MNNLISTCQTLTSIARWNSSGSNSCVVVLLVPSPERITWCLLCSWKCRHVIEDVCLLVNFWSFYIDTDSKIESLQSIEDIREVQFHFDGLHSYTANIVWLCKQKSRPLLIFPSIGVDFGEQTGHVPPIIETRLQYVFISSCHPFPSQYFGFPTIFFDKFTPAFSRRFGVVTDFDTDLYNYWIYKIGYTLGYQASPHTWRAGLTINPTRPQGMS